MEKKGGVYVMSQRRRKKKIEARRKKHSGVGRTDGPRKRKGVPSYTVGRRLTRKHVNRLEKADWKKTHDVVFGVSEKTGKPVLRLDARPPKKVVAKLETGAVRMQDEGTVAIEEGPA